MRERNRDFEGGTYRSPVYAERSLVHGMLYVAFATSKSEYEARAEEIILGEYEKLKTDLVPHDELDSAIGALHNSYVDAFLNLPGVLSEMIIDAVANGDDDLTKMHAYRGNVLNVSRRKVRDIANKYFSKNYARVLIKPA